MVNHQLGEIYYCRNCNCANLLFPIFWRVPIEHMVSLGIYCDAHEKLAASGDERTFCSKSRILTENIERIPTLTGYSTLFLAAGKVALSVLF